MLWNTYFITNSKVQKYELKTNTPINNEDVYSTIQTTYPQCIALIYSCQLKQLYTKQMVFFSKQPLKER